MNGAPDVKQLLSGFVHNDFARAIVSPGCDVKINVVRHFTNYVVNAGFSRILADELAVKQRDNLVFRIVNYIEDWSILGVPAPAEFSTKDSETLVTWRNERYKKITGREALPVEFGDIYAWLSSQNEREFLFACAMQLSCMDASAIFITDMSGDGGVDLIATIRRGELRGVSFFVQAKTSGDLLSRDLVLAEYGKFLALRHQAKFSEYLRALKVNESGYGYAPAYCILTNSEFKDNARQVARDLGILLRSRKQIAFTLSQRFTLSKLKSLREKFGTLTADLGGDLASLM